VPPGTPEEVGRLKAEIFAKIGEANRTLADDGLRAEYIAELEAGGQGEKVDVAAILAAEELFQKGQILVKARKFPEAVKMLDDAIKGNPDEGEYFAWRGYAKFFLNADKKAGFAEAMKDINVCIRKNPRVADLYYFQGNMHKLMGDLVTAKKFFKQCVELNSQHLEAQRELRMMK
jgi:tetratricopeptide (TPR) repeat protein